MKRFGLLALAAVLLPVAAGAQDSVPNPITTMIKQQAGRYGQLQISAAEAMPADKYSYKPTPDVRTFGALMVHVAQFNNLVCSRFTSTPGPDVKELKESDGKEKIVAAVKSTFDYCKTALDPVDDSTLGQSAGKLGPNNLSRGGALLLLGEDWFDHYSAQALYLRLNGIVPPSAQPR